MEVDLDAISVVRPPECPPWLLQKSNILFNLSDLRKGGTSPLVFQRMLLELFCRFPRHRKVYTDGSKEDKRTDISFVCDDHEFSCRINDEASICTAELLANEAAIEYIWDSSDEEFMIITDSLSSLQAPKSQKQPNCFQYFAYVSLLVWAQGHCFLLGTQPYWNTGQWTGWCFGQGCPG